ncbi:FecCD family ABC transporter permease [Aliicoccus persicus]|uniref:Iron complex transport system permease protein n=1 Tax=Aliicoccus persicus TaxID=930138 RepID=A0A662Z3X7_9STAP|nr:iron ABC transporter permease [Aliicoccus persicus]SEW07364.1 iron complex transport system permease protein [Aliicoccus persicus]
MNKKVVTLIIAIVIVGALSLIIGSANIFTLDTAERHTIMFDIRLPRVLMAIVVGTSLVMSGWVLQVVLRNPMADSFTLGMANAAILGSALTVSLGLPIFFQPVVSVLFGLLSLVIVLALAFTIDKNFANETLIINGILLGALWSGVLYIIILMNPGKTQQIAQYMFGSFANANHSLVLWLGLLTIAALFIILSMHKSIDFLNLGDERAHSLGVKPEKLRPLLIIIASIPPLVAISYTGMIAIVGIIIPQLILYVKPMRFKDVMVFSVLYGCLFMIIIDTIGRTVIAPIQIPTGVMVMLASVPILFFLMRKRLFRMK